MIKGFLILSFLLMKTVEAVIDHLDDTQIDKELPENVRDVYSEEEYRRWRSYHAENGRLTLVQFILTAAVEFVLLVGNLYAALFSLLSSYPVYLQYLIFLVLLALTELPISIPVDYYDTFVIEEKYGMNRSSKKTFWTDLVKDLTIGIALAYAVLVILLFFFERYGNMAILWAGIAVIAFALAVALATPLYLRMFNRFSPLPDGEVKEKLIALCEKHGLTVKKIVVRDASRRTTKSNAFCYGLTKQKVISLDDNLVEHFAPDEIVAVFAHEFAHARYKHTMRSLPFAILRSMVSVAALGIVLNFSALFFALGFAGTNYYAASLLLSLISWPVRMLLDALFNFLSRKHEYEADAFAAKEGYGGALIAALKKLHKEALSDINPHPLAVMLDYSHPTLSQRITAIREVEDLQKAGTLLDSFS